MDYNCNIHLDHEHVRLKNNISIVRAQLCIKRYYISVATLSGSSGSQIFTVT